jgi:hypothetical protein
MENTDEIVFGRTDDGPLSQSCPVCSCKKKMHLYLFSYGILQLYIPDYMAFARLNTQDRTTVPI